MNLFILLLNNAYNWVFIFPALLFLWEADIVIIKTFQDYAKRLFIRGNLGVDYLLPYGVFPENFPKNVTLILSSLLIILLCHFCYLEVVCVFLTLIRMITNLLFNKYIAGVCRCSVLDNSYFKIRFSLGATSIIPLYLYFHLGL